MWVATIRVASPSHAGLRTSAIHLAQHRGKGAKGSKSAVRQERKRAKDAARVYCVLGIPRGGKDTWPQCDLAKVLITEDKLKSEDAHEFIEFAEGTVKVPSDLNFSISGKGTKMLFEHLPTLAAEQGTTVFDADTVRQTAEAMNREVEKANVFGKLVSLRNANAQGVAYENRRRCIKLFSSPTNPNDTGRPEVQGKFSSPATPCFRVSFPCVKRQF